MSKPRIRIVAWRNNDQPLEVLAQMVAELAAMRSEQAAVFCLPGGITAGSVRAPDAPVRESGSSDQFLAVTATAPTGVPRSHGGGRQPPHLSGGQRPARHLDWPHFRQRSAHCQPAVSLSSYPRLLRHCRFSRRLPWTSRTATV